MPILTVVDIVSEGRVSGVMTCFTRSHPERDITKIAIRIRKILVFIKFYGLETSPFKGGMKVRPLVSDQDVWQEKKFDKRSDMWYNYSITLADMQSVTARLCVCLPTLQGLKV